MLIGIVGKTNTGKSTFFKAATLANVEISNRPFVTIKPNHGFGFVKVDCPEIFFKTKCKPKHGYCQNSKRFIPIELLDVAGLVPGAHKGYGLGNQFLNDLNQADALIHIIDISGSTNEKGESVQPLSYNPSEDIRFLELELDMWYLQILKRGWEKLSKTIQEEHKEIVKALAKQLSGLKVTEDILEPLIKNLDKNTTKWSESNLQDLASELRKKTKPMIIAANKIDVKGAEKNLKQLRKEFPDLIIIPTSAESELAIKEAVAHGFLDHVYDKSLNYKKEMTKQQKQALEFIQEEVLGKYEEGTGVQTILNKIVFEILNYIAVFPVSNSKLTDKDGNILPDAYLILKDSTTLDLAYKIHTDIGKKFIKAKDMKTGKVIGKEHKLKHLDVIEIITN